MEGCRQAPPRCCASHQGTPALRHDGHGHGHGHDLTLMMRYCGYLSLAAWWRLKISTRSSSGRAGAKWPPWPRMSSAMHRALTMASSVHSTTASYRPSQASSRRISIWWVMPDVARGTLLAVEKPMMISPEACAANEPTRPMPRAARLHRRVICEGSRGASVATTQMIDPALRLRLPSSA